MRKFLIVLAFLMLCCLSLVATGCATGGLTPAQEQQTLTTVQTLVTVAETAYAALPPGVVPAQDAAIAAIAIPAINSGLAAAQAAITAGDTNGFQVALAGVEAAVAKLLPIIQAGTVTMTVARDAKDAQLRAIVPVPPLRR